jgi:interferon gamma-inducible protein 30
METTFQQTQQEANGKLLFNCQHGPIECHGNKVHACAVASVTPSSLLLRYTTCMITDNSDPEEAGQAVGLKLYLKFIN